MSSTLKLTVAEYEGMIAKGAFDDLRKKVELIYGEIHAMNPAGAPHDDCIQYLNHWAIRNTDPDQVQVRIQSGLSLPDVGSRPEPDVLWVKAGRYRDHHPTADDVWLLIEVSDSSLKSDQIEKEKLYAEAGIVEYWIVDLRREQVWVHLDPVAGKYASIQQFGKGAEFAPRCAPHALLSVSELFGSET